ncbi:MAG: glycosidase, partial [Actinomycetia bacterium]|nr:glycosidase [Actinomycetes bacterium]
MLHRWERNPIITQLDIPFPCNTVFNGSPVKFKGQYILLIRIEGQQGYSFFALARSGNGLHFELDKQPCMLPATDGPLRRWECHGIEDPRITEIDGTYYIVYTPVG